MLQHLPEPAHYGS